MYEYFDWIEHSGLSLWIREGSVWTFPIVGFLAGAPDQYLLNAAFQVKVALLSVASVNVVAFYLTMCARVRNVGPGEQPSLAARVIGGASLCCWIGVMTAGRLLTFYRPTV